MTTAIATTLRRHIKIRHGFDGTALERCEDQDCHVGTSGRADCGRLACPSCGSSGSNLSTTDFAFLPAGIGVRCECGYSWIPSRAAA
jgi:hypothetical protein